MRARIRSKQLDILPAKSEVMSIGGFFGSDRLPVIPSVDSMKVLGLKLGKRRLGNLVDFHAISEEIENSFNKIMRSSSNIRKTPTKGIKLIENSLVSSKSTSFAPMLALLFLTNEHAKELLSSYTIKFYKKILHIPRKLNNLTMFCVFRTLTSMG